MLKYKIFYTRTTHFARNWATNGGAVFAESAYLLLSGTHSYVSNVAKYSGQGIEFNSALF